MKPVSVYEGDSIRWRVELQPSEWEACQRLVAEAEYELLAGYLAVEAKLQALCAEIRSRPEWDAIAGKYAED